MTVAAWWKPHARMKMTERLYIDLSKRAWSGMLMNSESKLCADTTVLSEASAEHGKDMVKLRLYHDGTDGAHYPLPSELVLIPYLCPHLRRYPSPPPCPPFYIICVTISFFVIVVLFHVFFLEPQRQHRSRQPAESVCVMNHGVPTTMCTTHNGPSPTW